MSTSTFIERYLARVPHVAAIGYAGLMAALWLAVWGSIGDIMEQRRAVGTSTDILNQLEGRSPSRRAGGGNIAASTGSPFLEGSTVTIAGAALLKRIGGAVARVGGNVLSSQVDLQGSQAKTGFVSVIASCEFEQPALQQLLYDLEAGMPFIFVDQLVVQAPTTSSSTPGGKLRVLLGASGQWQGEAK
jgi:general secretion pathway protein M